MTTSDECRIHAGTDIERVVIVGAARDPSVGSGVIVNAGVSTAEPQRRELWVVPAWEGEAPRRIDTGVLEIRNDAPAVSPVGRQVAFQAGEDAEIEVRAAPLVLSRR